MNDSRVEDDFASPEMASAPLFPGNFIVLNKLLEAQGPCLRGESRVSQRLCWPTEAMAESSWMSNGGMSERRELGARSPL